MNKTNCIWNYNYYTSTTTNFYQNAETGSTLYGLEKLFPEDYIYCHTVGHPTICEIQT